MAIDAFGIIALMTSLTGRLARHHVESLQFLLGEFVVVTMRAFVSLAGVVMTTSTLSEVVLVTTFELLDALADIAIVFERAVNTLAFLVALDWVAEIG